MIDGIDHINIYSNGSTLLGRMLSNFYKYPIETLDGNFMSVEGYWHWLSIPNCEERDVLRELYGKRAKDLGTELRKIYGTENVSDFQERILAAIWYKFSRNANMILPNYRYLPFYHYYNFYGKIVDVTAKYQWMVDGITIMRDELIKNLPEEHIVDGW